MDLWELTRVLFRRWYISVPMVAISLAAAAWVTASTGPEYEATGHVAVLPPEVQRIAQAGDVVRASPWNEEALAHAAQIRLEAKRLETDLVEHGFHGEWTVSVTGRLPVISVAVVAPSDEQAVATLHRLQAVVEEEVRVRQQGYDVPTEEQYRTVRYDSGESVDTSASSARRALVAAVGAGAVLTVAVVIGFDALARLRQRRREPADPTPAAATDRNSSPVPLNGHTGHPAGSASRDSPRNGARDGQGNGSHKGNNYRKKSARTRRR
jgi:hypothetical protein